MKRILRTLLRKLGYELLHGGSDPILAELRKLHDMLRLNPGNNLLWADTLAQPAAHSCIRSLLALHRIDLLLDVGANQGQFAQLARQLGYEGEIVSFEPLDKHRATLRQAAEKDHRWRFFPCALGKTESELDLHVFRDDTFSSLQPLNALGRSRFHGLVEETHRERVQIHTLDNLWPELAGTAPRRVLLKIDTQGHDLSVLEGASAVLPHTHAVLTEAPLQPIYSGAPAFSEITTWLQSRGFAISGLFPISHRPEDLSLIEMDCCFTRRNP